MSKIHLALLAVIVFLGLFFSYEIFGQEVDNTDCNLVIKEESTIPESFGFFTRSDIVKAYTNLLANCKGVYDDDSTYPRSNYLYDQLVWIGKQKLEGNAEQIGLISDPSGLALKALWAKAGASSSQQEIDTIPSSLQVEFANIRDIVGSYNENKVADFGVYEGSIGLSPKYRALCDMARGIYFNNNINTNKLGSTTASIDRLRLECLSDIDNKMTELTKKQDAYLSKTQNNISQKLQEAMNSDSYAQLDEMTQTLSDAKNNFVDIGKKIDLPTQNCNPNDF